MRKFLILILLEVSFCIPVVAATIDYDFNGEYNGLGERTGHVYMNGQRYEVREQRDYLGNTTMEMKNRSDYSSGSYKGTVDSFGYGTLRNNNGGSIKVSPY